MQAWGGQGSGRRRPDKGRDAHTAARKGGKQPHGSQICYAVADFKSVSDCLAHGDTIDRTTGPGGRIAPRSGSDGVADLASGVDQKVGATLGIGWGTLPCSIC